MDPTERLQPGDPGAIVSREHGGRRSGRSIVDYFKYFAKNSTIFAVDVTRLELFLHPCPSSENRMYSTGTPRSFKLATTCSASTTGTFVSFAPCRTCSGA